MNSHFPPFYRNTRSNGSVYSSEFTDISDWTDGDAGDGISSQVTFDGKSCLKLDSGSGSGNYSLRTKSFGTSVFGKIFSFSFNVYFEKLGTVTNNDNFRLEVNGKNCTIDAYFSLSGLYISNDSSFDLIDANIVVQGIWQEWTFTVNDFTNTVDIYLDKKLKYSNIAVRSLIHISGKTYLRQEGQTTANCITYINWLKTGNRMT